MIKPKEYHYTMGFNDGVESVKGSKDNGKLFLYGLAGLVVGGVIAAIGCSHDRDKSMMLQRSKALADADAPATVEKSYPQTPTTIEQKH